MSIVTEGRRSSKGAHVDVKAFVQFDGLATRVDATVLSHVRALERFQQLLHHHLLKDVAGVGRRPSSAHEQRALPLQGGFRRDGQLLTHLTSTNRDVEDIRRNLDSRGGGRVRGYVEDICHNLLKRGRDVRGGGEAARPATVHVETSQYNSLGERTLRQGSTRTL
eukprot:568153-Prorocentrum_minimum.AAC.1